MRIGQILANHRFFIIMLFGTCFSLNSGATEQAPAWFVQIKTGLNQYIDQSLQTMALDMQLDEYETDVSISYLDQRLNLATCPQPLEIEQLTSLSLGRNHVKVACPSQSWALNVPVELSLTAPVVVLNQPVPRGISLQEHHLDLKPYNLAELRNGYFLKIENVIGKQSKRGLAGQTVLNGRVVLAELLVKKGDRVIISASKGPMSVNMPGEALNDGRHGAQIRVKNLRSERVIRGTVTESGVVSVNF